MRSLVFAVVVLATPVASFAADAAKDPAPAASPELLTPAALNSLDAAEKSMFAIMGNADEPGFLHIAGDDYFTINADGVALDRAGASKLLPKFKGSTSQLTDRSKRIYGHTAVLTGRGKFYFKSILVAEVLYTQVWVFRDDRWQFVNWQGTMTGWPSWYPVIVTSVAFLGMCGVSWLVRRRRKAAN
jgi:hypothetical protein